MTDTATTDAPAEDAPATDTAPETPDVTAEVEKWKAQARKHEERAKANAKAAQELEQLRQQTMSETEKAIAQAKAEARAEALREVGAERVADAVRVATAGRNLDVDALLEGLDPSRFLTDDGLPDRDAIEAWVERIAPTRDEPEQVRVPTPLVDLGQGSRGAATSAAMALNGDPLLKAVQEKLKH